MIIQRVKGVNRPGTRKTKTGEHKARQHGGTDMETLGRCCGNVELKTGDQIHGGCRTQVGAIRTITQEEVRQARTHKETGIQNKTGNTNT